MGENKSIYLPLQGLCGVPEVVKAQDWAETSELSDLDIGEGASKLVLAC